MRDDKKGGGIKKHGGIKAQERNYGVKAVPGVEMRHGSNRIKRKREQRAREKYRDIT